MINALRGLSPPTLSPTLGRAFLYHNILSLNLSNLQTNNLIKAASAKVQQDLPMRPENIPYYRSPRIQKPNPEIKSADTHYIQGLLSDCWKRS